MNGAITYLEGGAELLDRMGPLWRKLTAHHAGISTHFSESFTSLDWTERKEGLLEKAREGGLRLVIAVDNGGSDIGYCTASIDRHRDAEVESLFIEEEFRRKGIGTAMVERILAWMDAQRVKKQFVNVAAGNEGAIEFYRRWHFFPRTTVMVRK